MSDNSWKVDLVNRGVSVLQRRLNWMITSTFIKAFESSPVHCLNRRPCLKRRKPGKGGIRAILDDGSGGRLA
jgi:hypothetical protein